MVDFQSHLANMSQPFSGSAGILVALVIRFIIPHVPTGIRGQRPFCFHRNDSLSILPLIRGHPTPKRSVFYEIWLSRKVNSSDVCWPDCQEEHSSGRWRSLSDDPRLASERAANPRQPHSRPTTGVTPQVNGFKRHSLRLKETRPFFGQHHICLMWAKKAP